MQEYINSGILETYVLGCASDEEVKEVLYMKATYPEVNKALAELEVDMEQIAGSMAITPPPHLWNRIEQEFDEITLRQPRETEIYRERPEKNYERQPVTPNYIDVESESSHMRIHKIWKWVFAAVFVLGKIFLGFAIYFYLESRQANEQIQELKTELRQLKK